MADQNDTELYAAFGPLLLLCPGAYFKPCRMTPAHLDFIILREGIPISPIPPRGFLLTYGVKMANERTPLTSLCPTGH